MSEKNEIKKHGMKALKNSGRGRLQKGDATMNGLVVDIKEYTKSYSISRDNWRKICTDAFTTDPDSEPALMLVLGEGSSKVRLAVVEWSMFAEMWELWKKNQSLD